VANQSIWLPLELSNVWRKGKVLSGNNDAVIPFDTDKQAT